MALKIVCHKQKRLRAVQLNSVQTSLSSCLYYNSSTKASAVKFIENLIYYCSEDSQALSFGSLTRS